MFLKALRHSLHQLRFLQRGVTAFLKKKPSGCTPIKQPTRNPLFLPGGMALEMAMKKERAPLSLTDQAMSV